MKVKNYRKRVVAGVLAVLMMAAAVPAGTDFGGFFGGSDIKVSAEVATKTEWAVGDTFDLTGSWVAFDDAVPDYRAHLSSAVAVPESIKDASQRMFSAICLVDKISESPSDQPVDISGASSFPLYLTPPSGKTADDVPTGFKIKGGSGTQADPYTFELVYPKTEWAVGDDINLGGKCFVANGSVKLGYDKTAKVPEPTYLAEENKWRFYYCVNITNNSGNAYLYTIDYAVPDGKTETDVPTGFKIKGGSGTQADPYTFELVYSEKADATVTGDPQPCDLTYTGTAQPLITEGTTSGGTMQYVAKPEVKVVERNTLTRLDSVEVGTVYVPSGNDGVILPTGYNLKVGNTIYTPESTFGINLYLYNGNTRLVYGEMEDDVLGAGVLGLLVTDISGGLITGEFVDPKNATGTPKEEDWTDSVPTATDAGNYTVYYRAKGDADHNDSAPASVTATIKKADPTVTAPQPCDLTYSGEDQALITEGTAEGGTMQYALSASPETQPKGEYSETVPSGKNSGDYYVWYKVKGDENHNDAAPTCVTATIKKADRFPTAKDLTYNGQAQELVKAGQSPAIKVVYALGEDGQTAPTEGYSETIPTATKAGTHYVWYKVVGDLNYNDMPPVCLPVTIKQAAATVTANNITRKWGEQDPALTYNVVGLIGNESLTGELARAEGEDVGTYDITQGTLANPNYNITFTGATFTIETSYFTITFVNEDGTVLQTSEIANGVVPEFKGETPTKASTVQEEFTFKGWSPELTAVTGAATYTATYESKRIGAEVNRLAGENRFATAVEISKAGFEKAENVILTSGVNYADGIAGVPLAARLGAPILLTAADKLSDATLAEIERLGAKNVYILGGEGVISADIEKALQEKELQTWRIAGDNRYATAAAIAQRVSEDPTDVFFVYGSGFADTLSVSAIAARRNAPIVYLSTNGELDPSIAQYLAVLKDKGCVKNAYVIGGTGVISDDMMNKATAALGLESATRIAGNDRYATSAAVNKAFVDNFDSDELCVATGADFADAVTGGVFAAAKKAPFILVSSKLNEDQIAFINSRSPMKINVFGGTGAVSDETVKAVIDAIVTAPNAAPQNITTQSE